jgi:ABC-type phosphate/phosphonate transport system permease subunit
LYGELVQLKQYTQKRGKIMAKTEIDVNQLPAGLTKKEFVNLPELKSQRSWFTWAGIVGIVTGVLGFVTVGQAAQLEAQGYMVNSGLVMFYGILSFVSLALGIALIVTKESKVAYALGIVGLVFAVVAIATGGTVGAGIIGTILAVFGARKIDTLWAAYQARG